LGEGGGMKRVKESLRERSGEDERLKEYKGRWRKEIVNENSN
jgi:hypothetical protein